VTHEPSTQPPAQPRVERRGAPRHDASVRWLFHLLSPAGELAAYAVLEDASASGLRLLVSAGCSLGPAVLAPRPPHPLAGRLFPICIERVGAAEGFGVSVGGRFTPPITEDEALALAAVR
jgi:hypothetical protein